MERLCDNRFRGLTPRVATAVLAAAITASYAAGEPQHVIDVGGRKQLFVDHALIESSTGITLTMNPPCQTGELLVSADQPWERGGNGFVWSGSSVLKEEGRVRLWYQVDYLDPQPQPMGFVLTDKCVAYAESIDGIRFTKPNLGLYDFHGTTANSVVLPGVEGCSVWVDPTAPPEARYRSQNPDERSTSLSFHGSSDGIHWATMQETNIGNNDTQNIAFWDPQVGRYVLYTRLWLSESGGSYRAVRRLESDDLVHWDNSTIVLQPDEMDWDKFSGADGVVSMDYYGACVFKYPDENGVYLMLAEAFWHWFSRPDNQSAGPCAFDVRLLTSRDGRQFEWAGERGPFLAPGPAGRFDSRSVWVLPKPVIMGDEIWIYYQGQNFDHDGVVDPAANGTMKTGISRAVMRLDGFVSADAGYTGGELTTPVLTFTGDRLEVNLDTGVGGAAWVELLDETGQPIPGFSRENASVLCGNSVRMPVAWGPMQDVGALAGRPIKLHFVLKDCKLYAFQFTNSGAISTTTTGSVGSDIINYSAYRYSPYGWYDTAGYSGGWGNGVMIAGSDNGERRFLVKFPALGPVPGPVASAKLFFFYVGRGYSTIPLSNVDYDVYELTSDWDYQQVGWTQRQTGINWTTPGGDCGQLLGRIAVGVSSGVWVEVDLPVAAVQRWVDDPTSNHGLVVLPDSPINGWTHTFDSAAGVCRPTLVLEYAFTVGGRVLPEQYEGDYDTVGAKFEFQPVGGGQSITRTILLQPDGRFALDNITAGDYNVTIHAYASLATTLKNVPVRANNADLGTIVLKGADNNGDNAITFEDFAILQNNYGQSGAGPDGPAALPAAAANGCGLPGLVLLIGLTLAFHALRWNKLSEDL